MNEVVDLTNKCSGQSLYYIRRMFPCVQLPDIRSFLVAFLTTVNCWTRTGLTGDWRGPTRLAKVKVYTLFIQSISTPSGLGLKLFSTYLELNKLKVNITPHWYISHLTLYLMWSCVLCQSRNVQSNPSDVIYTSLYYLLQLVGHHTSGLNLVLCILPRLRIILNTTLNNLKMHEAARKLRDFLRSTT